MSRGPWSCNASGRISYLDKCTKLQFVYTSAAKFSNQHIEKGNGNVALECRGEQRESNWLGSINVILLFALVHTRPYTYV